ncbi:hypothetical protein C8J57DRAFT_715330 [Mycena rebaudengoi]|nr:hypothetical protein C8J57DRAFT_715330 [Mycena rebaudengoi]
MILETRFKPHLSTGCIPYILHAAFYPHKLIFLGLVRRRMLYYICFHKSNHDHLSTAIRYPANHSAIVQRHYDFDQRHFGHLHHRYRQHGHSTCGYSGTGSTQSPCCGSCPQYQTYCAGGHQQPGRLGDHDGPDGETTPPIWLFHPIFFGRASIHDCRRLSPNLIWILLSIHSLPGSSRLYFVQSTITIRCPLYILHCGDGHILRIRELP